MMKGIDNGKLPPDHPMFSGGPQLFTPYRPPAAVSTAAAPDAVAKESAESPAASQAQAPDPGSPALRRLSMLSAMVDRVMANHPGLTREEALKMLDAAGF